MPETSAPTPSGTGTIEPRSGLSPRELEVLQLIVDGRSNREIGDNLFISTRTVATHVAHILSKLGLDSRAAAAAYAVRNGIAWRTSKRFDRQDRGRPKGRVDEQHEFCCIVEGDTYPATL